MSDPSALPCVLVVADRERIGELVAALSELPNVEVVVSSGGDDTIDLFAARRPSVVVVTASLQDGDARSLIVTLRGRVPRAEVAIVVVGDDAGPVRTALDALDLAPDRFVTRPLSARALRFAVTGGIDAVRLVRGAPQPPPPLRPMAMVSLSGRGDTEPGATLPPRPPSAPGFPPHVPGLPSLPPGASLAGFAAVRATPVPRAVLPLPAVRAASAVSAPSAAPAPSAGDASGPTTRAALRARWEALADSMAAESDDEPAAAAAPAAAEPPPPIVIKPRRRATEPVDEVASPVAWRPGSTDEIAPQREPTLILSDAGPGAPPAPAEAPAEPPASSRTRTGDGEVVVAARTSSDELWSEPMSIPALADRDAGRDAARAAGGDVAPAPAGRDAAAGAPPAAAGAEDTGDSIDGFPDDLLGEVAERRAPPDLAPEPEDAEPMAMSDAPTVDVQTSDVRTNGAEPRDFARELRAKMSIMAQRLFQGGDAAAASPADHAPRHDHHTEIDLAALGEDPPLAGELEARGAPRFEPREIANSPSSSGSSGSSGSWDTLVRERGLPDTGSIVRGVSDAAMLLARMFAQNATGRIAFRKGELETVVYIDRGRPVFASSNEPRDRMGALLLREGKITASQYERCQAVVAESGRRMGEILVDLGYLKRRELLPAVRRHVEDLVYSLFGWERGTYAVSIDPDPSAERIRMSRHPAALILEGIRRKFDRTCLERLIGPPSTVIELRDRDRLGGIVHIGDLAPEERGALAAFDGQTDLAQVASVAGVDIADVLPLAWALCVLGLATARRADTDVPDEGAALVGETDLAIDRERVRARWQLVTEADYFALLGVRHDATAFEIRRAYQAARRDFAADCFPSDLRRELARELDDIAHVLDEAFRVLRDDRLRQTYLANLVDG